MTIARAFVRTPAFEISGRVISAPVEGITCAECVTAVSRALSRTRGVKEAFVDLGTRHATVLIDPARTTPVHVTAVIGAVPVMGAPRSAPVDEPTRASLGWWSRLVAALERTF